jgi:tetratricopeptide (TPR) repeat protein
LKSAALVAATAAFRSGRYEEAAGLYREEAVSESLQRSDSVNLGICELAEGDTEAAVARLKKLAQIGPEDSLGRLALGASLEARGHRAEAAKQYQKSIAAAQDSSTALLNLGYICLIGGNLHAALNCIMRAMESKGARDPSPVVLPAFDSQALPEPKPNLPNPAAGTACLMLGVALQERGRFEQARSCFVRSLELNPINGFAYYSLTHLSRVSREESALLNGMRELLNRPDLPRSERSLVHYSMGKAMDDLGDYESAMGHFDQANAVALSLAKHPFDRAEFKEDIDWVIQTFTQDRIQSLQGYGSESELPVLIVGMMRSGTTLVEQIISSHPEVAAGEELIFWRDAGSDFLRSNARLPSGEEIARTSEAYLGVLRQIGPEAKRVTDKMPQNFIAVGLIHAIFPNARFLFSERHPVDTCLSIYMTSFRYPMSFANSREDIVFFYRQFRRLMDHWKQTLKSDRFLEVRYEELLADRETSTRRLIDFCGLEWNEACLHPEQNQRPVKTASVWQVRQPVYSTSSERWRRYEPWLGSFRELL